MFRAMFILRSRYFRNLCYLRFRSTRCRRGDDCCLSPSRMPFVAGAASALLLGVLAQPLRAYQESPTTTPGPIIETIEIASVPPSRPSVRYLNQDMVAFGKRHRNAEGPVDQLAASVDLCGLYLTIVSDDRFGKSEELRGYRGRIGYRLKQEAKAIERERRKRQHNSNSAEESAGEDESRHASAGKTESPNMATPQFQSAISDPHWLLAAHFVGGGAPLTYYGSGLHGSTGHFLRGAAAGEPFDHGPELVTLIEAILHPDFWESGGGSGRLHYYRPLRILVVRAMTTVHEDIEDFLERLR